MYGLHFHIAEEIVSKWYSHDTNVNVPSLIQSYRQLKEMALRKNKFKLEYITVMLFVCARHTNMRPVI